MPSRLGEAGQPPPPVTTVPGTSQVGSVCPACFTTASGSYLKGSPQSLLLCGDALHAYPSHCWRTLGCRPGCLSESSAPCPLWGCPHPHASWSPEHRVGRGSGLGCHVALPSPQPCGMPPGACGLLQVPREKGQARGGGLPGALGPWKAAPGGSSPPSQWCLQSTLDPEWTCV